MKTEPLTDFLDKWTNWERVHSEHWRDQEVTSLEYEFRIPYLTSNTLPNWQITRLYENILKSRFRNCRNGCRYPDKEAKEVSMNENLVHPVVAYHDCKRIIENYSFCGWDFENSYIISNERVIHPIILIQEINKVFMEFVSDQTKIDLELYYGMLHVVKLINGLREINE